MELKFTDAAETVIEGLGIPWGGPMNGKDLQREYFSPRTNLALDWFPRDARPVLYHHGMDKAVKAVPVGRVMDYEVKPDLGVWVKAQLDISSEYLGAIKELVKRGKLFFSSGSMRHLADSNKATGEITMWPWVEISLTPSPVNPLAEVDFATAKAHFEAVGMESAFDAVKSLLAVPPTELHFTLPFGGGGADVLDDMPLVEHADFTAQVAATLTQRTKDLQERRVKAGRVISTLNRKRLGECLASMQAAATDLAALLDSTDPAKVEAKAAGLRRLQAQLEASRLRSMTY